MNAIGDLRFADRRFLAHTLEDKHNKKRRRHKTLNKTQFLGRYSKPTVYAIRWRLENAPTCQYAVRFCVVLAFFGFFFILILK